MPIAADAKAAVQGRSRHQHAARQPACGRLVLGAGDLLGQLPAGTLIIDCSTIAAATSRKVAEAAQPKAWPLSTRPRVRRHRRCIAGTLTFMVGGDAADLERARPMLEKWAPTSSTQAAWAQARRPRSATNMLLGIPHGRHQRSHCAWRSQRPDPKVLSEIMRRSSGGNWALEKYNPLPGVMETAPASKGYAGGFGTDLMLKDLGLAQENAAAVKASHPLGAWRAQPVPCIRS